ncbi:MAG: DUF21 domain-containing protein [Halieaceae bacterium]
MYTETLTWIGIALLVLQSGTFSGLNLAMFGVTALRLDRLADMGDTQAAKLLLLRRDSNFLLSTILWGNVGTNVLLTMLSDSVMAGAMAFMFSTFVITFGGEIIPQAYFSRNALKMASLLSPLLRFYQVLLYPLAKPSGLMLDAWLGKESISYIGEHELRAVLRQHAIAGDSDISRVEGQGAINFLDLDDLLINVEGKPIDSDSLLYLPFQDDAPCFPTFSKDKDDPFIASVRSSRKSWVLIAASGSVPDWVLDASGFLRATLIRGEDADPFDYCHRPLLVSDESTRLGEMLARSETMPNDGRAEPRVIVLWGNEKRIITGSDILGFLLRGISGPGLEA